MESEVCPKDVPSLHLLLAKFASHICLNSRKLVATCEDIATTHGFSLATWPRRDGICTIFIWKDDVSHSDAISVAAGVVLVPSNLN